MVKSSYDNQHYMLQDKVMKVYPAKIEKNERIVKGIESELLYLKDKPDIFDETGKKLLDIKINGVKYTDREEAGKAFMESAAKAVLGNSGNMVSIGEYKGFTLSVKFDPFSKNYTAELMRDIPHRFVLGTSPSGNISRIENAISSLPNTLEHCKAEISELCQRIEEGKGEMNKPFPQAIELHEKEERLNEIEILLSEDSDPSEINDRTEPSEEKEAALFSREIQNSISQNLNSKDTDEPSNEKDTI